MKSQTTTLQLSDVGLGELLEKAAAALEPFKPLHSIVNDLQQWLNDQHRRLCHAVASAQHPGVELSDTRRMLREVYEFALSVFARVAPEAAAAHRELPAEPRHLLNKLEQLNIERDRGSGPDGEAVGLMVADAINRLKLVLRDHEEVLGRHGRTADALVEAREGAMDTLSAVSDVLSGLLRHAQRLDEMPQVLAVGGAAELYDDTEEDRDER